MSQPVRQEDFLRIFTDLSRRIQTLENYVALLSARFPLATDIENFTQPPQVRAYRTTNTAAINNAAWTSIAFDLEAYDGPQQNMHESTINPSRLTVYVPGTYSLRGCFEWAGSVAGNNRAARMIVNQAVVLDVDTKAPIAGGNYTSMNVASDYRFIAGDYVQIEGYQDSGAGLVVMGSGNLNPYLEMTWIGV